MLTEPSWPWRPNVCGMADSGLHVRHGVPVRPDDPANGFQSYSHKRATSTSRISSSSRRGYLSALLTDGDGRVLPSELGQHQRQSGGGGRGKDLIRRPPARSPLSASRSDWAPASTRRMDLALATRAGTTPRACRGDCARCNTGRSPFGFNSSGSRLVGG
jgi:hypothetical protein